MSAPAPSVPAISPSPPAVTPPVTPSPVASSQDARPTGDTSGARAIYQPLPELPPDLRRHALDLVATVRFTIAADGSALPELVEATPDPALNAALLDGFRRWRFFPAVERGRPVASILVLRVPVVVR